MLRILLPIVLFFTSLILSAQQSIMGQVVDSSNQPLEAVYVYWDSNYAGAVTNSDGKFQLEIPAEADSLTFDQYEFELKKVSVKDFHANPIVQLKDYIIELNEALVLSKKSDEILKDVLKASKMKLNKSLLVHTFYREFISVNNEFTTYSDGLLDYFIKRNSGKSDLFVKQSRHFQLNTKEESEELISLSISSPFDIRDALGNAFDFESIEKLLKEKNLYEFQISEFNDSEGKTIRKITISPKEGVKELLMEGVILYDEETNLILDYNLKVSPETIPYSKLHNFVIAKIKINDLNVHYNFRLDEGKYRLVFRRVHQDFYIKSGKKIDDSFQFTSDFVVLDYKENEQPPVEFKKYRNRNLFEAGTNYTEEYWKSINAITPTQKEQDLIDTLQKN